MGLDTEVSAYPAVAPTGYAQRLERSLGKFAMFALQYSYLSVLTGIFQLFGFGYSFGGPAMIWAWAAVFVGQLLVAFLFMELSAHYPIAGAVYNWSKKLGSPAAAWMAGWMVLFTAITTVAAVALSAQIVLPSIWSGFQIIGNGTTASSFSANAVLLGGIMIALTTVTNCLRVKVVGIVNNIAVLAELIVGAVLVVLLFCHPSHRPTVVFNTLGLGAGHTLGYLGAFLVASFIGAYQFYGFDSAGSLAEESADPHRQAPRSLFQALLSTFVMGFLLILATMMAIPNLHDPNIGTGGLPYIVTSVLGTSVGKVMLIGVFVAIFGCAIAIQAAGTRMIFGMARDGKLPFSEHLAKVSHTSKAVIAPTIGIGVIAVLLLVVNIKSPQIVSVVTSIAIITNAVAYLCVTVPMLRARRRGVFPPKDGYSQSRGYFSLGKAGQVINVLAIIWGVALSINLLWPRKEVYNATPPYHWYLQYGPILFTGVVLAIGSAYYLLVARHRHGVLESHRAGDSEPAAPAPAVPVEV
jgi:urea carboxylase system permease